jgi:hypothetical protein
LHKANLNNRSELFQERFVLVRIIVALENTIRRNTMRKIILSAAALAVLGLTAVPFAAPAKADPLIVIGQHHHHHHDHDHDKTVIIKKNGD